MNNQQHDTARIEDARLASGGKPSPTEGGGGHTAGPWLIERKQARGNWLTDLDGEYVAMVCLRNSEPEEDANARLIAAGPTMYDYIAKRADAGDGEAAEIVRGIHAPR